MLFRKKTNRAINILIIVAMLFSVVIPCAVPSNAAAVKLQATGAVKAAKGAPVRQKANVKSKKIAVLKKDTKVVITGEVFTDKKTTKNTSRWYAVTSGNIKGYIRSDVIKNIKYSGAKAKTTDFLFYRYGPNKAMKSKGLFKKGASLQIVLEAYLNGSKEKWYKVKVGNEYYYSCANWIKVNPPASTAKTSSATEKKTSSSTQTGTTTSGNVKNTVKGATYPSVVYKGDPFSLRGKVVSNKTISKAVVKIVRRDGVSVITAGTRVKSRVFDISKVDTRVKFGTLAAGNYKYRVEVYIDDKKYPVIIKAFRVIKSNRAERIANKAFELAWPLGTSGSTYEYGSGRPTPAYKKALNDCYPEHYNWGTAPSVGASCDVFVGTVIRASGVDTRVPRGLDEQFEYYPRSSKWKRISYSGNRSVLKNGDIILDDYSGPGAHTFVYLRRGGNEYIAEAGYQTMYGRIATGDALEYQLKYKSNRHFEVYRIKE